MRVKQLHQDLLSLLEATVLQNKPGLQTVDTIKAGDPETEIHGNCSWMDELHLGVGKSPGIRV